MDDRIIQLPFDFDSPKLCECGCGQPAPLAARTNARWGHIKGKPLRFINGHHFHRGSPLRGEQYRPVSLYTPAERAQRIRERHRLYDREHPERIRAWQRRNRDKLNAYRRNMPREKKTRRSLLNRGYVEAYRSHRVIRGTASAEQIAARWAIWGGRCWMCGTGATCTDHVIPVSRGGTNWPANLRPACTSCNARKGAKKVHLIHTARTVVE